MTDETSLETGHLVLDGPCTVRTSDDVHAKLLEMTARYRALDIDCSAAEEIDLSFVQLLIAARLSARLRGRSVTLTRPAGGLLRAALERGGLLSGTETADRAFWLGTECVS
jgi:ABC-type transporter Mla MlaB component